LAPRTASALPSWSRYGTTITTLKPRRSPNTEIPEQGQSRLTNYNETPYASSSLTIARHKHPSGTTWGNPYHPQHAHQRKIFDAQVTGHAHTLNAPGKFLMSAPEHDTPRRARAYLLTDDMVSVTASQHAEIRPSLDDVSRRAVEDTRTTDTQRLPSSLGNGHNGTIQPSHGNNTNGAPMGILCAALSLAPDEGVSVPELINATRMSRPWVYQRLRELADRGQVTQISRGRWRAVIKHSQ
jgi:hypothetical protein